MQGVTKGFKEITRGYKGLLGVTKSHKGYKVLQGVKGLQGVT